LLPVLTESGKISLFNLFSFSAATHSLNFTAVSRLECHRDTLRFCLGFSDAVLW